MKRCIRILEPFRNYFWEFYEVLDDDLKEKVDYVLQIVITVQQIPEKFFKHLEDGIYEIRIEYKGNIYRIFTFFDKGNIVILLQGIQKKSQKLNRKEIERAKKIRTEYYETKASH